MVNYCINYVKNTFSYIPVVDTISIGGFCLDNFTDSEVTEYISDCFIHEHIHRVLYKFFNVTTSKLFDGIEYLFRNDKLHRKHLKGTIMATYQEIIKLYGYKWLLNSYNINDNDIFNANILCNSRRVITKSPENGL